MGTGKTIFSVPQMEAGGCKVVTTSARLNRGRQPYIHTQDGYVFPLSHKEGLAYLDIRPVLDHEWDTLPHTYLTKDVPWDPTKHDHDVPSDWIKSLPAIPDPCLELPHDSDGNVKAAEESTPTLYEDEDDDGELVERTAKPVSRQAMRAHLTSLVQSDLDDTDSDGELSAMATPTVHFWVDSDDETDGFQPIPATSHNLRYGYDVTGRPRRRAASKPINYGPTRRRSRKKPASSATSVPRAPTQSRKPPIDDPPVLPHPLETVLPGDSDSEDSVDDSGAVLPRTDFNNPAKSTLQDTSGERYTRSQPQKVTPSEDNYSSLARHFGGTPLPSLKKTFESTTQLGRLGAVKGMQLYNRRKAPNPALNIPRRNEPVATDTVFGGTPAVDNGSTCAQFFVGRKSGFRSAEGLGKSTKKFATVLMNHIRRYGAMDQLVSDSAKVEISARVTEILNIFGIKDYQSEPYNKNQNFAERVWQQVQEMSNRLLNMGDCPNDLWLAALEYACFIINHTAFERLGWRTPTEWLLGYTPDITVLLQFYFYEPVYYQELDGKFPRDPKECLGRYVGVAENVGNAITYKILTEGQKIIHRSVVRSAAKPGVFQNVRANSNAPTLAPKEPNANVNVKEEKHPVVIRGGILKDAVTEETATEGADSRDSVDVNIPKGKPIEVETVDDEEEDEHPEGANTSRGKDEDSEEAYGEDLEDTIRMAMQHIIQQQKGQLPTFDASHLIGRTFITTPDENGEQRRAQIEDMEATKDWTPDSKQPLFKFRLKVGDKRCDEIVTYNRMLEWIERDSEKGDFYNMDGILDHKKVDGKWQLLVQWSSGQTTWNPLSLTAADDPITVALYAKRNKLLDEPSFKHLKKYTKTEKRIGRAINQGKLKSFRNKPRFKYGYQVPRSHAEAMLIDEKAGNTKWVDSEGLEVTQLMDYETFESQGIGVPLPEGYKKVPYHVVYDVKHDGRHKSRLVANGSRTDTPIDSTYSGVVSLQGIRIVTFLAELNDLEVWGTDIGNAYLESYTKEKVGFVAGPEFGKWAGHTMIIRKAQYGLKSSGKCWHDRLHDVLRDLGWTPSKVEEDIWMRDAGDHYEYIAVYVDDLLIASKNPKAIIDSLEGAPVNFKLKGTGPLEFHLGCNFYRDDEGLLCIAPHKYIERMVDTYNNLFGENPKQKYQAPLEENDHPELDESELLDLEGIGKYQSLIGVLQWTISLGRFDIATAVMTMSSFRVAPRQGHLERLKRVVGYLVKFKEAAIRVRTEVPDYSDLVEKEYDWARSVYGEVKEQRAPDAPTPKGKTARSTTYVDANLYHDHVTGRAVTGVLHLLNGTPISWHTKKQGTVETAKYGSEFAAARVAIQQIAGLRLTLQYLGVPIERTAYLFGDNESVVKSGSIPHSQLNKRHHALAYHYTREAVASGMVTFNHIPGVINPADILSKHWSHAAIYPTLRPIMFYRGDTLDLIDEKSKKDEQLPTAK